MSSETPNVYSITWQGKEPEGAPSAIRLFVTPVVGRCVLVPLQWRGMQRFRVVEITPVGYPSDERTRGDDYAADIILEDS